MDLVCQDTQLNISRAYLKPGFAFGGSCLPKDLRATLYLAKMHDVELPMHAGILASNQRTSDRALRQDPGNRQATRGHDRPGLQDRHRRPAREPAGAAGRALIGKGFLLRVYDPTVHLANLIGANRSFIEQHLPHIGALVGSDLTAVVNNSDVLVVGLSDRGTIDRLKRTAGPDKLVIDLVGIEREGLAAQYIGLAWM